MAVAAEEKAADRPADAAQDQTRSRPSNVHPLWRDMLRRRMLALADAVAALAAAASFVVVSDQSVDLAFWAAVSLPAWILLAKLHGLYDRDHRALRHLTVDELPVVLVWVLTATAATAGFVSLTPAGPPELSDAFRAWAVAAVTAVLGRAFARFLWRRLTPPDRVLVLGSGPLADATRRKLELFPDVHAVAHGTVGEGEVTAVARDPHRLQGIDRVIVATHVVDEALLAHLVVACRRASAKLSVVPASNGMLGTALHLNHIAEIPVVDYNSSDVARSTLALKRALDVVGSLAALALLAPLFAAIAVAIRIDSRGPVFFSQRRAGQNGRAFRMHKFRTMVASAEERLADLVRFGDLSDPMFKLRDDPRVTRVGRFLRRTSLDELPQLLNVLKGDMSLVGPRPEQVELVERYRPEHRFRLSVKPGLTGPMQVYGRGELTFEERLAVERDYIENLSLARDLRVLALTLPVVLTRRGAF
jgi:exopolysaccharide biosynthesis polyprenyl glycosylphosphotransferase